ncbi:MAG: biotin/lipoyl-binding protein [Anaerolineae bacterium]|nr:biotin/lipoyl-binding protein [Anaerolineae bacterium]
MVCFLLLIVLASAACNPGDAQQAAQAPTSTPIPTAPAVAKPTYLVQRGDVQELLEFTGRWQPRDQMTLSFEVSGLVRKVNVQRNDAVGQGDLLADLDITALEDQLAQAELQLETAMSQQESGTEGSAQSIADAEVALANAHLSLENTKASSPWASVEAARLSLENAKQQLINAQRNYDIARSDPTTPATTVDSAYQALKSAQNGVKSAETSYFSAAQSFNNHQYQVAQAENAVIQAELALERARDAADDASQADAVRSAQLNIDQLKAEIARSSLYAPIDGVILEVTIKPSDQVQAYTTVITIGQPEPKEIIANLAIGDANRLSVGMVGVCQAVNRPETAVQCAVRRIPLSSRDADQTTRIAAALEGLANGELVEAEMPLQVRKDVLWLPPAAIRTFQNRTFVVIQTADGSPRSIDVQLGLQTDDRVEIVSGVNEGDIVVGQ